MREHKINVCTRVPKKIKEWMDQQVAAGYYGGIGDLLRFAIYDYKEKIEKQRFEDIRRPERLIEILKADPELRKKVLKALAEEGG